jgi:hypothetical protein
MKLCLLCNPFLKWLINYNVTNLNKACCAARNEAASTIDLLKSSKNLIIKLAFKDIKREHSWLINRIFIHKRKIRCVHILSFNPFKHNFGICICFWIPDNNNLRVILLCLCLQTIINWTPKSISFAIEYEKWLRTFLSISM